MRQLHQNPPTIPAPKTRPDYGPNGLGWLVVLAVVWVVVAGGMLG